MRARIPKGTVIRGTFDGGERVAGKTYTVNVITIDRGHPGMCYCRQSPEPQAWHDIPDHSKHCYPPRPAEVVWAGSGGYWTFASVSDVELLPENAGGEP